MVAFSQKVQRIEGLDRRTKLVQDNIAKVVDILSAIPILDGVLLSDVELSPTAPFITSTEVEHRLGRTPLGWFVTAKDAQAVVWEVSRDDLFLGLNTSADVTIDLWVF